MCQRYFQPGRAYGYNYAAGAGALRVISYQFTTEMRANPTFAITSASAQNMSGGETFETVTTRSFGFFASAVSGGDVFYNLGFDASAEL